MPDAVLPPLRAGADWPALAEPAGPGLTCEVVADVADLSRASSAVNATLIAAAARTWSANTIRAFLSDLRFWEAWCRHRGIAAAHAAPDDVARNLRKLGCIEHDPHAPITRRSVATIERYLVSIGWAYRMAGTDSPTAAPLVRLEPKAVRNAVGTRQRQARGMSFKGEVEGLDDPASGVYLAHLLKAHRRDLLGLRDRALLLVAYDSGCRRCELIAIQCAEIREPSPNKCGILLIAASKADQDGKGAYAYLSPAVMLAIDAWREAAGVGEGLHPNSVTLIYRGLLRAAHAEKLLGDMSEQKLDLWIKAVSSHSICVGVAQDGLAASEGLPAIMQAYRWRNPKMVMRYGAKLAATSGASARLAKRFQV